MQFYFKNGFSIFSLAVAVGSKGCMWEVAAAVWAVTVLMWDVVALCAAKGIIGPAWNFFFQFTRSARKNYRSAR